MRASVLGFCVLALVAGLSCTEGDGGSGVDALRDVADEAREAGTVRVTTEITLDSGAVESVRRGEGAYDFDAEAGTLATELSTGRIEQPIDMIVFGPDLYQRYPESSPKWFRSDVDPGEFVLEAGLAPTRYLDAFAAVGGADVEAGDAEELDGVSATRYDFTSSALDQLAGPLGLPESDELESVAVWIGDDGLVRRFRFALTLGGEDGEEGRAEASVELYDYGADVAVEPPEEFQEG